LKLNINYNWSLLVVGIFCLSTSANADVISGEITFVKKVPFAGVLFVKQNKSATVNANMDQLNKKFTKKVSLGAPGTSVIFNNGDSFDHNIFANDLQNNISFDIGLMPSGQSSQIKMDWKEETMVRIGCKIHPKMRSYIANVNSDFYQEFEFQKKVKIYPINISDVPADNHEIKLIIPKYESITVTLLKGESKTIDIIKKGKVRGSLIVSRQ
jgi:plastocyanin